MKTIREEHILSRLNGQRELWVETAKAAAERLNKSIGPSVDDVAWLASVVGQLATQVDNYSMLRGRLIEHRSTSQEKPNE